MGKWIRYKIGDIFLIELEDGLKGAGRVLKKDQATIFIELFKMKPIKDKSEFDLEAVLKEKPISMTWCYHDDLTKGDWEIIGHKPVEGKIEMPYFWIQDALAVNFIWKREQILMNVNLPELKLVRMR